MAQMTPSFARSIIANGERKVHTSLTCHEQVQLAYAFLALDRIRSLDPAKDSKEGHNEWGEADCFDQAQAIARGEKREEILA